MRKTRNISEVQEFLGHSSINMYWVKGGIGENMRLFDTGEAIRIYKLVFLKYLNSEVYNDAGSQTQSTKRRTTCSTK